MGESRTLIIATVFAAVAASVAASASTIQAYVSWSGRYDVLKASLTQTALQRCIEASTHTRRMFKLIADVRTARSEDAKLGTLESRQRVRQLAEQVLEETGQFVDSAGALETTIRIMNIDYALARTVGNDELRSAIHNYLDSERWQDATKFDSITAKLATEIADNCSTAIKQHVFG